MATERIVVLVELCSSNLQPLIKTQQTGMTHFPIRPCFDVRLQPARPNGIAVAGGQRFETGQEEAGWGVQQATKRSVIGQMHVFCSLKLEHTCQSTCGKNKSPVWRGWTKPQKMTMM